MRVFLITSLVLCVLAISGLYLQNPQANAVPVSYNVTQLSLSLPFSTVNLNPAPSQYFLMDTGNNGTITTVYNATIGSSILKYVLGEHQTLPISIDATANLTSSASVAATQKLNVTVGVHNNRMLVVGITFRHDGDNNANNRISTVKIGASSMNKLINKTVACGVNECTSELWWIQSPLTGATTITITPVTTTTYHIIAGVYSLYNVRISNPTGVSTSATGTSITPSISLTPTFPGTSYLINNIFSLQTASPSASTDTIKWIGKTSAIMGSSQIKTAPVINSVNKMNYTTTNVQWISTGMEVVPIQDQTTFNYNLAIGLDTNANLLLGDNKANINGSKFYWLADRLGTNMDLRSFDVNTATESHLFYTSTVPGGGTGNAGVGLTGHTLFAYSFATVGAGSITTSAGNQSTGGAETMGPNTNQYFQGTGSSTIVFHWDNNSTTPTTTTLSQSCALDYTPTQALTPIDSINCDRALSGYSTKYWYGILTKGAGNYGINSTLPLLNSIFNNAYRIPLTIPSHIYGIDSTQNPDVRLVGHWSGQDWLISYTSTKIMYAPMAKIITLLAENRAQQPYLITTNALDSSYALTPSSSNPKNSYSIKFYGPSINSTTNYFGMFSLISGYTTRLDTNNEHDIRTIDPRWSNTPSQNYPAIYSSGSLFPIFLTVSNAPIDSGMIVSSQSQIINNIAGAWAITNLDTSKTGEVDLPPSVCANVYVADISVSPFVYTYQGNVCATGVNTKTLPYTNTLPLTFYTLRYGATHSYTPSTNALSITVRSSTSPFTYNVLIKNSTGVITQNFTTTINGTINTHNFNVTNATKPAGLFVSISGVGQIYSAYVGSPLSFASTVSFFHQYFSYQGFDFLSFIPLIFASMFTRNTVGIGTALVVVLIGTLSFLSVVVVSDTVVIVSMVVAVFGLIGYRGLYG